VGYIRTQSKKSIRSTHDDDEYGGTRPFSREGGERRRERERGKSVGNFNAIGIDADRLVRFHEPKVCGVREINQYLTEKSKERRGEEESEGLQRHVDEDYRRKEQQH